MLGNRVGYIEGDSEGVIIRRGGFTSIVVNFCSVGSRDVIIGEIDGAIVGEGVPSDSLIIVNGGGVGGSVGFNDGCNVGGVGGGVGLFFLLFFVAGVDGAFVPLEDGVFVPLLP